jgi:GNAT superfamily N-acetyltransferase
MRDMGLLMDRISDRTGTPFAIERQMHRGTVIYYVRALDTNGDIAPRARTSDQIRAGLPVFVARAVLSVKRGSVSEILVWPDHQRRGIASALYRQMESDLGKPLIPSRIRSRAVRAFWASRAVRDTSPSQPCATSQETNVRQLAPTARLLR